MHGCSLLQNAMLLSGWETGQAPVCMLLPSLVTAAVYRICPAYVTRGVMQWVYVMTGEAEQDYSSSGLVLQLFTASP